MPTPERSDEAPRWIADFVSRAEERLRVADKLRV